jgi:hypothetical protein
LEARLRGWDTISLSVSEHGNVAAQKLYAKLEYVDAGVDPVRVSGTIMLRGRPFDVDDTLVYLVKALRLADDCPAERCGSDPRTMQYRFRSSRRGVRLIADARELEDVCTTAPRAKEAATRR